MIVQSIANNYHDVFTRFYSMSLLHSGMGHHILLRMRMNYQEQRGRSWLTVHVHKKTRD